VELAIYLMMIAVQMRFSGETKFREAIHTAAAKPPTNLAPGISRTPKMQAKIFDEIYCF